jgi:two-component system C4-dicarboxylate transport sensor histidine kinase DctB
MAELEKQRADDLTGDLHKIQRDQAVWAISASLLHELKNPLHALGLLLDEVLDAHDAEPELRKQLLLRARAQVERIVSELGTLRALPSSTPPELPNVNLEDIVRAATAVLSQKAPQVRIECNVPEGPEVHAQANPAYVRIILENLLENAVEALSVSDTAGERRIEVSVTTEGTRRLVDVSDNGPGLDREMTQHLFEPLNTTKATGMGLGLSIARALARAMGGDLLLIEQPIGVKFRIVLDAGRRPS